jgi:hypothetical protein
MATRDPRRHPPLGPSDSSDSASDLIGADDWREDAVPPGAGPRELDAETDAEGTGERGAAGSEVTPPAGADIAPDRIIGGELPIVPDGLDRSDLEHSDSDDAPSKRTTEKASHR